MANVGMTGGTKMQAYLERLGDKLAKPMRVRVGFLEGATDEDAAHTPFAYVAAIQEFGSGPIPPRPFFRSMVDQKSGAWPEALAKCLDAADNDLPRALALMGEGIASQLGQSIEDVTSPALSPITLMLREMQHQDSSLVVTGAIVAEAARRVAAGENYSGASTKPLIFTHHLIDSIAYEVAPGATEEAS